MKLGVIFPQCMIGTNPETIRGFARTAEAVEYDHLLAYDHVLGVDPDSRRDFEGPYDFEDSFYEPLTLFSHLGAVTTTLEFVTGVLVLPQRQTALVAKQAATVDVLTDGRLTLGVGVGWNQAEYESLGQDFQTRGRRISEQIELLRALWTDKLVDYTGEFHSLPNVGINPLPTQQPIPLLVGGSADVVLRRAALDGDGWVVPSRWKYPDADMEAFERTLQTVREYRREGTRPVEEFTVLARMTLSSTSPDQWVERVRRWERTGISHLAVSTMGLTLEGPEDHVETIREFKTAIDDSDVPIT